jgi:hypothetical protein
MRVSGCLPHQNEKKLLQRSFQQRPREPLHLDALERREFLCGVREGVDDAEPVWLRLHEIARYDLVGPLLRQIPVYSELRITL